MIKLTHRVIFNRIPELTMLMRTNAERVVRETTISLEADVKESMNGSKSGRSYRRGDNYHQASAPGQSPAIDTGVLVNSIQHEFPKSLLGVVYTNVHYGPILEYGSIKMAERPFMRPAANKIWPEFLKNMTEVFDG